MRRDQYFRFKNRYKKIVCDSVINAEEIKYKRFIRARKRLYQKSLNKKLRVLKSNNAREYWKILNNCVQGRQAMGNIALKTFLEHFKKLSASSSSDKEEEDFDPRTINHSENELLNKLFTVDELLEIIALLKNNKACGIDYLRNEFLKNCSMDFVDIMCRMFNIILVSGVIPNDWCIGLIMPLYKNKGSKDDPNNYRGITLLSVMGKFFTSCINKIINNYLDNIGLLGEEQAGFRNGYSTVDHIFVLNSIVDIYLQKRKKLFCAFIDYSKAFDMIDRSSLWYKLLGAGINGKIINVIFNLYQNAKSCVKSNGKMSDFFSCDRGVRQGENLSPILFAIYLNDFEYFVSRKYSGLSYLSSEINSNNDDDDVEIFLRLYVLLYADDTIVMAASYDEMQKALNAVYEYCELWKLTVNMDKTKIIVFSNGKIKTDNMWFKFGDLIIDIVDDYVYLGVKFNYNKSFKKTIAKQVNQARKAMFSMLSKAKMLNLPTDVICELFNQTVTPVLLYGSEVWGFDDIKQINVFHKKFLKNLLHVNKFTPDCIVYGETGTMPIDMTIENRMVNFWSRIVCGKNNKLSFIMYKLIRSMHYNNTSSFQSKWIAKIESILNNAGFSHYWLDENLLHSNRNALKNNLKVRLSDMYRQKWHDDVWNNSQCTFYRMFKDNLFFENYLEKLNSSDRINLCKFRSRAHQLPVTRNRFREVPIPMSIV